MNKYLPIILSVFILFSVASCNEEGSSEGHSTTASPKLSEEEVGAANPEEPAVVPTGSLTADVDGFSWSATANKVAAHYVDGALTISGVTSNGSKFVLEIGEKPEIGIFPINQGKLQSATYASGATDGSTYYCPFDNTTGVINLTLVHEDKVEGTFSFTGSNMREKVNVTDGEFSAPVLTKP